MLKRSCSAVVLAALSFAVTASSPLPDGIAPSPTSRLSADSSPDTVLATLGDRVIRETDFQHWVEDTHPPERAAAILRDPTERQPALEEYWDHVAILAKAQLAGIDQELRFRKAMELAELKILSHLLTERHRDRIVEGSRVSPEEVRTYYEQHRDEFLAEPHFVAHHLLVYVSGNPAFPEQGLNDAAARARAEQARADLRAGGGWETVARTYSDDAATNQRGGLIRDGRFGYFAPEVERAVRAQPLGEPGDVVRSVFGYHVLQVVDRVTEPVPRPFEEIRKALTERLSRQRAEHARTAFLMPFREEVGLELREAGLRDAFVLDKQAVAPDEVLAEVGGRPILESDFQWFLEDALIPEQRMSAYSRPGARQGMLGSLLDMLVLEAKARQEGMHQSADFIRSRAAMEAKLLTEFMQQRDQAGPFCRCGNTEPELMAAQREYSERVRAEVGLEIVAGTAG